MRNIKIQYLSWLACALFFSPVFSLNALAAAKEETGTPWYQIEVIIFANQSYLGMSSETWPEGSELQFNKFIELIHPEDAKYDEAAASANKSKLPNFDAAANPALVPYQLLDSSELQLVPFAKKLSSSQDYQVIMHIGWRQPTLDPDKSIPVFVYQGVNLPSSARLKAVAQTAAAQKQAGSSRFTSVAVGDFVHDSSQYGQLLPVTEMDVNTGPVLNPFFGTLRLSVSRYLHLEADLNYRVPILKEEVIPVEPATAGFDSQASGQQPQTTFLKRQALQTFHMYETRRMRSKEIHYFDHPMFGVISRVIPYEIKKSEANFDPASQAFTPGAPGAPKTAP